MESSKPTNTANAFFEVWGVLAKVKYLIISNDKVGPYGIRTISKRNSVGVGVIRHINDMFRVDATERISFTVLW